VDTDDFDQPLFRQPDELTLTLDGWEGPLDLLLNLARAQKVDLAQISILQLVEQYLVYINEARALKLEIAADYLVMAAWLAYLKSCLLLPKDPEQDPSPEEIAFRLQIIGPGHIDVEGVMKWRKQLLLYDGYELSVSEELVSSTPGKNFLLDERQLVSLKILKRELIAD